MVPVAVDGLVVGLDDGLDLVERVVLAVDVDLDDEDDDESLKRSGPRTGPISAGWSKLNQFEPGTAHFDADFQSMIAGHSHGVVDGLAVLQIGRKDVAQVAQV